jgi:hypothetical protein
LKDPKNLNITRIEFPNYQNETIAILHLRILPIDIINNHDHDEEKKHRKVHTENTFRNFEEHITPSVESRGHRDALSTENRNVSVGDTEFRILREKGQFNFNSPNPPISTRKHSINPNLFLTI